MKFLKKTSKESDITIQILVYHVPYYSLSTEIVRLTNQVKTFKL